MDAIIYTMRINVKAQTSPNARPFLNLPDHTESLDMGKRMELASTATDGGFNERLSALRKAAGFTQVELATELEISQRMVAYYESAGSTPPAHLLPAIAQALGVSIDALYGHAQPRRKLVKQEGDSRLRRRLLAIEKLGTAEKRQVLQLIDAYIERGQLRSKVQQRAATGTRS
jgi:transcriptional regulator with XRE-family HTH domain